MKQISELYNFSRSIFSPYEAWDQSWDYGRLHTLPLWPEFVCISRYGKDTKYTHNCPAVIAIEIPLEGNLNIALPGKNITLSPGEFLILPAGEQNTLATSNSDFCRKISCGLCGPLAVSTLSLLKLEPGRKYIIKNPETVFTILKEIERLLFYKSCFFSFRNEEKSIPDICGKCFHFLMLLAASVPDVCNSFVSDAIRIFEIKAGSHITVEQVCRELNITPVRLTRLFKQHTNLTPKQYLISMRMKNAETLLRASMKSVKEIAFLSGYSSPQKFCREFAKSHNLSPRQYRKLAASAEAKR